ncbi:unnamed protein product [Echinostoma caproni]|uniref:Uncharacterized protein n=1 Tax=Echinostoma caproni TaxID=27848 RepID=A0A183ASM8_9TREM|nr:unnamed protein product [Echinostoma caproni]
MPVLQNLVQSEDVVDTTLTGSKPSLVLTAKMWSIQPRPGLKPAWFSRVGRCGRYNLDRGPRPAWFSRVHNPRAADNRRSMVLARSLEAMLIKLVPLWFSQEDLSPFS